MQVLGADREGVVFHKKYDRIPVTLREGFGLEKDVARHLSRNYGTRALQVAQIAGRDPRLARRLAPRYPVLAAEVLFAVEQEYALTAVDVLARRTRLAYLDAKAAADATPAVVELMAGPLGWDAKRKAAEVAGVVAFLRTMVAPSAADAVVASLAPK
jgi:glycerol-3-phosphate dehydrogenase